MRSKVSGFWERFLLRGLGVRLEGSLRVWAFVRLGLEILQPYTRSSEILDSKASFLQGCLLESLLKEGGFVNKAYMLDLELDCIISFCATMNNPPKTPNPKPEAPNPKPQTLNP